MRYLVSVLEMAELDRQTIGELALPGRVLMETAGQATAAVCTRHLCARGRVVVACGPGNNGGDGYVVARVLAGAGHEVQVYVFADRARIVGDANATLLSIEKMGDIPIVHALDARALVDFANHVKTADVVVDALLGIGAQNEVRGPLVDAITVINEGAHRVVAVDIPSGIDGNTGAILGTAIRATTTVTFGFPKRGHYLYPGADLRGELVVADIGIPTKLAQKLPVVGRVLTADDLPPLLPHRRPDAHKGSFGTLVVFAGSPQTPGAALLAAQGAARSGAGLVCWATDHETLASACSVPPDITLLLRKPDENADAFAERMLEIASAVVIGPGLSTTPARLEDLKALVTRARVPLVIDADGLNLMAQEPALWRGIQAPVVITPHPKELSRQNGQSVAEIQADRFAAAMQFALAAGCTVVLKGAGTVIAEQDGVVSIAAVGNPGLATGGTGDVLAGIIGALLAQGFDPAAAAQAGVLAHGMAGDLVAAQCGKLGLIASDLPTALGQVWAHAEH